MNSANETQSPFTFHYVDPGEVIAIGAVMPAVCVAVVAFRFYCRIRQSAHIGVDDWTIMAGLTCIIGMGACLLDGAIRKALGYPAPLPPANATNQELLQFNPPSTELIGKLQFAFQILLVVCYGLVKISIVCFYRRIFVTHTRSLFDVVTKITITVLILWTFTFILIIIFSCGKHIYANWGTPASQEAYCEKIGHTSEDGLAASDLILDVILLFLPLPSIWNLHMTRSRKLAVTSIMVLGLSSIAASVVRLVVYVQIIAAANVDAPVDLNQTITLTLWWSMLECGLAIIAACIPTLTYLFTSFSTRSAVKSICSALSLPSLRSSRGSTKQSLNRPDAHSDLEQNSVSYKAGILERNSYPGPAYYQMVIFKPTDSHI